MIRVSARYSWGGAMKKIPVGDTVSRAYAFGFERFLSVLGVTWFPYLLMAAVCGGLSYLAAPELFQQLFHGHIDQTLVLANLPHLEAAATFDGILFFFASCMVQVGLLRLALGIRPRPAFIFFSLGSEVWMMVGALIFAALVSILVAILTVAAVAAIIFGAGMIHSAAAVAAIRAIAIVAGILWFVYYYVRLMFFFPAVGVAEKEIGLGRAGPLG